MDPSSSTSLPQSLHLAMAALLGASFMAISAFYIHRRTVDHILHRILEIRRAPLGSITDEASSGEEQEENYDDEPSEFDGEEMEPVTDSRNYHGALSRSVDESSMNLLRNYRVSSSMPDVVSATEWFRDHPMNRSSSHENLNSVPIGLPSLRMSSKHDGAQISSSYKRIGSVGRIKTPISPGRNAFESAEDSDDDDDDGTQLGDDSQIPFYPVTIDSSNSYGLNPTVPFRADDVNCGKNQKFGEVSKEAGAGADMNGGITDSTTVHAAGNDLVFVNNVLSARSAALEPLNIEEEDCFRWSSGKGYVCFE